MYSFIAWSGFHWNHRCFAQLQWRSSPSRSRSGSRTAGVIIEASATITAMIVIHLFFIIIVLLDMCPSICGHINRRETGLMNLLQSCLHYQQEILWSIAVWNDRSGFDLASTCCSIFPFPLFSIITKATMFLLGPDHTYALFSHSITILFHVDTITKINGKLVLKTLDKVYRNVVPSFHHVSSCSPVQERADALRTKIANQLFEKERADALRTKIANQLFEKAVEIFIKDVKVFASFNGELFKEITKLLTLENFRKRHAAHAR
ncbi:hypothetical protein ACJX0J_031142, partial [Zea mays]